MATSQARKDRLAAHGIIVEDNEDRAAWVSWLETYGAGKFYDAFMANAQGAESVCVQCNQPIYLDIREGGGVPDWGSNIDGIGLDYGCNNSPETTDEGTGGHFPRMRSDDK